MGLVFKYIAGTGVREKRKVLMVIKTSGLQYDDRLRKEALSLQKKGIDVKVVALEDANRSEQKNVFGLIPVNTIRLRSRGWFPRAKGLLVKTIEMYSHFLSQVFKEKPHIVWIHNMEQGGLVPILALLRKINYINHLVWDQHELPSDSLLAKKGYLLLLRWLMNLCNVIVMANDARKKLVRKALGEKLRTSIEVLYNYPDRLFIKFPKLQLPEKIQQWLRGQPYILAQGGANPNRYLNELISAIMTADGIKLIVVGPYQERQVEMLIASYGRIWQDRILFTGSLPQMEVIPFIDHAIASIVLYTTNTENLKFCSPNRLYQALARGIPVLVGVNPTMAEEVKRLQFGIVLEKDGQDPQDIQNGLKKLIANHIQLVKNAKAYRSNYIWETQYQTIGRLIAF